MLIRTRNHRHVGMSHQNTQTDRIDVVLEAFRCERMPNAVRTQTLHTEFFLQTLKATIDRVFVPSIASTISKNRPWQLVLVQLLGHKLDGPFGQEDDAITLFGFVERFWQNHNSIPEIAMLALHRRCFKRPASSFPHELQKPAEGGIARCLKDIFELFGTINNLASRSSRFILNSRDWASVDVPLLNRPIERTLNSRNRVMPGTVTPLRMVIKPLRDVLWFELPHAELFSNASEKRGTVMSVIPVRAFRSSFLAPVQVVIKQFGYGRLTETPLGISSHDLVVLCPSGGLIRSKIDLAFANLDVPTLRLFAEEGFWLSHSETPRQCDENKFAD
jgi:hypothetical protein